MQIRVSASAIIAWAVEAARSIGINPPLMEDTHYLCSPMLPKVSPIVPIPLVSIALYTAYSRSSVGSAP
jgi:hypothetical protein